MQGVLRITAGGRWAGVLTRRTTLRFCGAHASAIASCELHLAGQGLVLGEGEPGGSGEGSVRLRWVPVADSTSVVVTGNCPDRFAAGLGRLYRTGGQQVEFDLPAPGARPSLEMIDPGWVLELRPLASREEWVFATTESH